MSRFNQSSILRMRRFSSCWLALIVWAGALRSWPVLAQDVVKHPGSTEPIPQSSPSPLLSFTDVVQNRALWPRQVLLIKPTTFPVMINQRPKGQATVPPGRSVEVLAITHEGLTLSYQGGSQLVPADSTNLMELVRRTPLQSILPKSSAPSQSTAISSPPRPAPVTAPLESIRRKPSAFPAQIVLQIHQYLQAKVSPGSDAMNMPPIDPDLAFSYYEAMERFDAVAHDPDSIYRLAELVLQRAEWLLSQSDAPSRLRGVYLASITSSKIAHNAPDPLLTSAIFDIYIYPRINLVPVETVFDNQSRAGVISNCSILFATEDIVRRLQYFDLQLKYAPNASAKDMVLYAKAHALKRAKLTKEALEVWSQISDDGQAGWMKKSTADFWKRDLPKEKPPTKKQLK